MGDTFGTLHCTLLDRRSSVPLARARATCVWRSERVTVFDADEHGSFTAELPEGVYDLVVSARGYLSLFVRGVGILAGYRQSIVRGLIPGEGQPLDGEPSTAIAGFVRDRVGLPVANAMLYVTGENGGAAYTTHSDHGGAYVVHGVLPGMYDLAVRSGDKTLAHQHVAIAHVKTLVRADLRLVQL